MNIYMFVTMDLGKYFSDFLVFCITNNFYFRGNIVGQAPYEIQSFSINIIIKFIIYNCFDKKNFR